MLSDLINKTNNEDFYSDGNLYPIGIKAQIGGFNTMELELIIEESGIKESDGKYEEWKHTEYWKIIAHKAIKFDKLYAPIYLPYVKLRVLYDHPLLWDYKSDKLECELNGIPDNYNEFVGVLYHTFDEYAGNWILLNNSLFNAHGSSSKARKRIMTIPEPMKQPVLKVCQDFGIDFHVTHVSSGRDKGYAYRPNAKLLMFGNEDVCDFASNLGQPYIIAEDFMAHKK
ncbi:hypothetical protein D770_05340 [Flammeovirgaceae bacterium 311]|nr:hypothetical protein D770_05340 [Flammeovirgaceae bacterium 311]